MDNLPLLNCAICNKIILWKHKREQYKCNHMFHIKCAYIFDLYMLNKNTIPHCYLCVRSHTITKL
jgi:hypothetical protein